ncbi:MAG: LCP family protein [Chloroflexi bacterium]|nr:LCP family protein [Chloroflexota bacterium]
MATAPTSTTPGWHARALGALTLLVPLLWITGSLWQWSSGGEAPIAQPEPAAAVAAVDVPPPTEDEPVASIPPSAPAPAPDLAEPPPAPSEPDRPVQPAPFNPLAVLPRWNREQTMNILLMGVDRRTMDEIPRTDTIMLASIDLVARRASLVSIPRDLIVTIPGYGQDRVNTAFPVGEMHRPRGGGAQLARETVERNFGMTINHYLLVDFNCFRGLVDAVGGVRVDVPRRLYDPRYPTPDYGTKTVVFEPGVVWLDGERALEYVRTRHADTDFGRMRRQQQVISALRDQALQIGSLAALPQALSACSGMASDLNAIDLMALGTAMRDIRASNIAMRVIDERMAYPSTIASSGASVLIPRWDAIRAMIRSTALTPATVAAAQ